jgi:hypothetical protein
MPVRLKLRARRHAKANFLPLIKGKKKKKDEEELAWYSHYINSRSKFRFRWPIRGETSRANVTLLNNVPAHPSLSLVLLSYRTHTV